MINLCDLALSSMVFDGLTGYTSSLSRLAEVTNGRVDLTDQTHRMAVLKWLNDWGCRHLSKEQHETASASLCTWYTNSGASLFSVDRLLWDLTDVEIAAAAFAYGSLKGMPGAWRTINGRRSPWLIGPTAASKVLFALRPHALLPWDDAIRDGFECDGSAESYLRFLREIREQAKGTAGACEKIGFGITGLPNALGCPNATVIELINKYLWMKHSREWSPPTPEIVARWAAWGSGQGI
ncbi:MAG: hypothetical protein ACM3US_01175 [Sphingomonadaceae bacterium]